MSFDFGNIDPIRKAQATYKDGGGLGGGGMYMRQGKKRKEDEEDLFTHGDDEDSSANDIMFENELEEDKIPHSTLFNKFVNWFRIGKDQQ